MTTLPEYLNTLPAAEVERAESVARELAQPEPYDWLVWSNKWGAWHSPDFCGYTQDISRAGRFTRTRAMRYHDSDPKLRKHGNEARHVSAVRDGIEAAIQAKIDECAATVERLRAHLASLPS